MGNNFFKSQIPERSYSIRNVDPEFQPQGKLEAEAKIMSVLSTGTLKHFQLLFFTTLKQSLSKASGEFENLQEIYHIEMDR